MRLQFCFLLISSTVPSSQDVTCHRRRLYCRTPCQLCSSATQWHAWPPCTTKSSLISVIPRGRESPIESSHCSEYMRMKILRGLNQASWQTIPLMQGDGTLLSNHTCIHCRALNILLFRPSEFVQFVLQHVRGSNADSHLRPQHEECPFCLVDFTIYGRVEDMGEVRVTDHVT